MTPERKNVIYNEDRIGTIIDEVGDHWLVEFDSGEEYYIDEN